MNSNKKSWEDAKHHFSKNQKHPLEFRHFKGKESEFVFINNNIYQVLGYIGSGSVATVTKIRNEESNVFALKTTGLDEISYPKVNDSGAFFDAMFDDDGNFLFENYEKLLRENSQYLSSEEYILQKAGGLHGVAVKLRNSTFCSDGGEDLVLVMPLLGTPIEIHVNETCPNKIQTLDIASQMVNQLELLHQGKMSYQNHTGLNDNDAYEPSIHLDASLGNFVIDSDNKVWLIDFGLTCFANRENIDGKNEIPVVCPDYLNIPEAKDGIIYYNSDCYKLSDAIRDLYKSSNHKIPQKIDVMLKKMKSENPIERPRLKELQEEIQKQKHEITTKTVYNKTQNSNLTFYKPKSLQLIDNILQNIDDTVCSEKFATYDRGY